MSIPTALCRLLRAHPWLAALNVALATTIALLDLLPGPLTRALFDRLTGAAAAGFGPEAIIGGLLAIALARTVIKTNAVLIDQLHAFLLGAMLRRNLLSRLLARPTPDAEAEATGATLSRLRDDAAHLTNLVAFLCYGISITVLAGGALVVLVRVDPWLTVAVFLPVAATVAIVQRLFGRLARYRAASSGATAAVTGALGELFGAVAAVQVAGAERHLLNHIRDLGEERRRLVVRDLVLERALGAASASTVSLGTGLLLLLSAGSIRAGTFTVGDFALFVYYLPFVGEFTRVVGEVLSQARQARVALDRLVAVAADADARTIVAPTSLALRGPLPELAPPAPSPTERFVALDVRGLTYRHAGTGRGIAGVDLRIARGEFVVVVGRVGAGKTTLLRTLLGQLPATAGTISWNGTPVAAPATWLMPPRLAYTPQVPRLFSDTVRDNILLGLPERAVDLPGAVRDALLERDLATLPAGLATAVGPRGVRLSGGQVQRVAAARMFVRAADLLIVDDLSSALDGETERALWARLRARPETTVLAVSHRCAALERADRIIVLREGEVLAVGSLAQLLADCEEMRSLWDEGG